MWASCLLPFTTGKWVQPMYCRIATGFDANSTAALHRVPYDRTRTDTVRWRYQNLRCNVHGWRLNEYSKKGREYLNATLVFVSCRIQERWRGYFGAILRYDWSTMVLSTLFFNQGPERAYSNVFQWSYNYARSQVCLCITWRPQHRDRH